VWSRAVERVGATYKPCQTRKEDKLGALWAKSGGKGDYFSGEIEIGGVKTKVVVFANGFKQGDKHPDWIIYKSQPKGERTVGADDAMPF
jgi:hypothetical protein